MYPDKPPVPYFRELAASTSDYIAAMRRLASRFTIKEMRPQAAVAVREILDGSPADDDGAELVRRLHDSVTKAAVFDHPADDVERIVSTLSARTADYRMTPDVRKRLVEEFEVYARDIATRAHVAAKESLSVPALSMVADAYHAYLSRFGKLPAADEIRENYAEALLAAKRYYEAGRAYEDVSASTKKGDEGASRRGSTPSRRTSRRSRARHWAVCTAWSRGAEFEPSERASSPSRRPTRRSSGSS